ncbi:TetR/AcrR family transcriptional regulator [Hymenobacter sp. 15J16-1T3B]|uniref:TetR/AcrR family transcriptional regulator n=1 Tax=Hymenobacter sp. 15J16-1T3B TaxID=2886941 RepID=UPI001D122237|nr:TetR/AcrR family transcriptional regulator [Hymenobacter sp. 15J16-1T3B]MCC3158430.1 TetR/AcrR family transcriptional regulator [Hymenobacter sp. 15J16-1T3B]
MTKAERTRQFIIEQTAPIFNKQGYAGTTLSDLTTSTGLTKGAIYGNFENKEEVALAAFDYNLQLVQQGLQPGLDSSVSVLERLRALPRFYRQTYPKLQCMGGCPVLNAAVEVDDAPPAALQQRVQQSVRRWQESIVGLIQEGQQIGEIPAAVDAPRYATLFIALVEGSMTVARATANPTTLLNSLAHIEHLIDTDLTV